METVWNWLIANVGVAIGIYFLGAFTGGLAWKALKILKAKLTGDVNRWGNK